MTKLDSKAASSNSNPESRSTITKIKKPRGNRTLEQAQDAVANSASARSNAGRLALALENAQLAARIADDNRAKDVLVLDVRAATSLVDYFVIATAASRRQANAIASEIDQEMKRRGDKKLGIEGTEEGSWVLIDYGDFVVHVFAPEARGYYAIEELWGDAPRMDWAGAVQRSPDEA